MTDPVVRSETVGGVCTVTLDDPERKNASVPNSRAS